MKKLTAGLFTALAMVTAPMAIAPAAHADVCGDVGGRHVSVGGCTPGVAGDAAVDAATDAAVAGAAGGSVAEQAVTGQPPCYTPEGVPYYTPGADPCN